MGTAALIALWIVCVLAGAAAGWLAGYLLWRWGFELLGSAVALVGAGAGGIMAFLAVLAWQDRRERPRKATP
jgi:hypothetical protein